MASDKILVSSCLLGATVRYDGSAKEAGSATLTRWHREGRLVSFCPEIAAGLPIPRPPVEIADGRAGVDVLRGDGALIEADGTDVTAAFLAGAELALALVRQHGCRYAILTDGSPSCGSSFIYDGSFSGVRHTGEGVTARRLRDNGVAVFAQNDISQLAAILGEA